MEVSSPQEKSQIFFINFLCYIINMEQPYSYVLYKVGFDGKHCFTRVSRGIQECLEKLIKGA